jgi:membrane protease subunit HflK
LQKVDPPAAVIDSFRDVQRANTDADRMRNEAESYHNDIVPRARGDAARIVAEADATRQANIAEATGQAQRFLSVLKAYDAAKEVTLQRLYIETMQDILSRTPSVVVDQDLKGVVPYLPLGDQPHPPSRPLLPAPPASSTGAIK